MKKTETRKKNVKRNGGRKKGEKQKKMIKSCVKRNQALESKTPCGQWDGKREKKIMF